MSGYTGRVSQACPWPRPICLPTPTLLSIGAPHLVQVVGEVDNTQVLGMKDDMGYLLDDTGLPVDDGQVQGSGGWGVRSGLAGPATQSILYP